MYYKELKPDNISFYETNYSKLLIICFHISLYSIIHICYQYNYKDNSENLSRLTNIDYCKQINLYSMSSFSYSLVGIVILKYKTPFKHFDSFYPYFLIVQGIISYLSDSNHIDQQHWSHSLDISFASYNLLICLIICKNYKISKIKWLLICFGILSLKIGGMFVSNDKVYIYCFFHILWHTIIPIISIYTIIENTLI